jgi:hypothetical protein
MRHQGALPAYGLALVGELRDALRSARELQTDAMVALERHRADTAAAAARLDRRADELHADLRALRDRQASSERRFFGQILTVSAVLVAAFALIVSGAQVATRIEPPTPSTCSTARARS